MVVGMRGIGWSHFGLGPNSEVRPEQIRHTQKPLHISQKKTGLGPVWHLAHPPLWESCENEAKIKRSEGAFCARHGTFWAAHLIDLRTSRTCQDNGLHSSAILSSFVRARKPPRLQQSQTHPHSTRPRSPRKLSQLGATER